MVDRWRSGGLFAAAISCLILFGGMLAGYAQTAALTAADFQTISSAVSPRVAFSARQTPSGLTLVFDVAPWGNGDGGTSINVGLAAAKTVMLTGKQARVSQVPGATRYIFTVPSSALVTAAADWKRLRMGAAVAWMGGALGKPKQIERFHHLGTGGTHTGLSQNPADWMPLDMTEFARQVADEKSRILLQFTQPMDGKATIVIEDAQGNRIRNLIAGKPMAKGAQRVEWDGLDEDGTPVKPGTYHWRAISHPGIAPHYLFSFENDGTPPWRTGSGQDMWGPDHTCLTTAVAGKDRTFFGGSVAESGYAMVAVDQQGVKQMHYNAIMGTGLAKVVLATDDQYLYAAHDGMVWGEQFDPSRPDAKATQTLSITRYDINTGNVIDFPNQQRFAKISALEVGPGGAVKDWQQLSLGGFAAMGGKLYLANQRANAIQIFDAKTAEKLGDIPLANPGALTTYQGELLAVSGNAIALVDPATRHINTLIPEGALRPAGLAADAQGNIYVSDAVTSTVKVFDATGNALKTIGKPGGAYKGTYDPERMVNPRGLAVAANGWLWVTEERTAPKRVVAWDLATGKVVKEKFGPTAYGAGGGGFDVADQTRWIGQGAQWQLDFATKSATCTSILGSHFEAMHYEYLHQDGRTFLIGTAGYTAISELLPDGSVKDIAFIGSTHRFSFALGWNPPAPFIEAFNKAYPTRVGKFADKGPGVLWVDKNGDGEMQVDEFDFSTDVENFAGAYWGHEQRDLTLRLPATVKGKRVIVVLQPEGFYPGGAPKYPTLNAACAAGTPIALDSNELETAVDRFGDLVVNSDPKMTSFAPDGKLRWTYPNRWSNVHGSHAAPLPEIGMMQGALFFLGMAPLDASSDVFVMNGNHGRFFVITSDGLYLDEMFKDVRLTGGVDAYLIGGECFGGMFNKSAKDGQYYLQSGHTDYRIFRISGLNEIKRSEGKFTVTAAQVAAAERNLSRKVAATVAPKVTTIAATATPKKIDGREDDWAGDPTARWDKSGQYPVTMRVAYDATNLYLYYNVADGSPWVNNGKDWTLLFKTGDSIDLQLGLDPNANPQRTAPVPGDFRLLIAPFQGKPTAVLYRHRVPGTTSPVSFISPWRSEKVDSVKIISTAQIAVLPENGRYRLEAAIPLAELGWKPRVGSILKADVGVLYGDDGGSQTLLRSYWSNQQTNLVNDVPGEIMLMPNLWGAATITEGEGR